MYKDSGGELVRPETVASPASGAMALIGLVLSAVKAFISMIFLIGVHQRINQFVQGFAHLML
jgi:hypothetical protein